jgi:hypothetical protein
MWWAELLNSIVALLESGAGGAGGSYESIATATGDGSSATITFSSIPSTYTSLQLRANILTDTAGKTLLWRLNGDTGTNYTAHSLYGSGAAAGANNSTIVTSSDFFNQVTGTGTTQPTAVILDLHDYASTTKYKTVRSIAGVDKNGSGEIDLNSGLWLSTAAVTSLTIRMSSGYFTTSSTFSLYGIKGA